MRRLCVQGIPCFVVKPHRRPAVQTSQAGASFFSEPTILIAVLIAGFITTSVVEFESKIKTMVVLVNNHFRLME